jgi:DNA-binding MarR family transcriptional regulator
MRIEWKRIPKEEAIYKFAARYPDVKPKSLEAFLKVMWVTAQIDRALETHFSQWNLSRGRFMLIMTLYKDFCGCDLGIPVVDGASKTPGVMSPSELALNLDVTRGNMTGLLDGLEREGWILRGSHPEDRRGLLIRLTEDGLKRIEDILPTHYRRMNILLSGLSTSEAEVLIGAVAKLSTGLEAFRADVEKEVAKDSEGEEEEM